MMAPIQVLGHDRAEVEERARKLLKKVRLSEKADSYPGSFPAASSSAWPSPAHSRCSRT